MAERYCRILHHYEGGFREVGGIVGQLFHHHGGDSFSGERRNESVSVDGHAAHGHEHRSLAGFARVGCKERYFFICIAMKRFYFDGVQKVMQIHRRMN